MPYDSMSLLVTAEVATQREVEFEQRCSEECDAETIMWGWVGERSTSEGGCLAALNASNAIPQFAVPEVHGWKQMEAILTSGGLLGMKHGFLSKLDRLARGCRCWRRGERKRLVSRLSAHLLQA
jgi:hypothetical protein